jgi:hypothetical protein
MGRIARTLAVGGISLLAGVAHAQFSPESMVAEHNAVRAKLSAGGYAGQPVPVPPLPLQRWNEALASTAQQFANTCPASHNPSPEDPRRKNASCLGIGNPYPCCTGAGSGQCRAGENLYFSTTGATARDAVQAWAAEVKDYTYAPCCGAPNAFSKVGHYTQLVWSDSTEIGCGIATGCPPIFGVFTTVVACNYSFAGNFLTQVPYAVEPDTDQDGVPDDADNCKLVANTDQRDTDHDGYGNLCDPDFNNDGVVNFTDLARLKASFFKANALIDMNGDGIVNFTDLARLKSFFLRAPGPSGLACAGLVPCPALLARNP